MTCYLMWLALLYVSSIIVLTYSTSRKIRNATPWKWEINIIGIPERTVGADDCTRCEEETGWEPNVRRNEDNLVGNLLSGGLRLSPPSMFHGSLLSDCFIHPLTPPLLYCACMLSSFITPAALAVSPPHRPDGLSLVSPDAPPRPAPPRLAI